MRCAPIAPEAAGQLAAACGLPEPSPTGTLLHGLFERQLVAYIEYVQVLDEVEILAVGVAPERRRQGLGRAVLEALLAELPAAAVYLEVRASNAAAIRLYESLGFAQTGRRVGYYADGEDAVLYSLTR